MIKKETKKLQKSISEKLKDLNLHNLTPPSKPNFKEMSNLKIVSEANGMTIFTKIGTGKMFVVERGLYGSVLKELQLKI